jgi:monoamine oxidase
MKTNRREFTRLALLALGGVSLARDRSWAYPQQRMERSGRGKQVVILGAGLAGLVAGWELQKAGHNVTILEAQLHPGGRVHTIREGLSDDFYAEAGAGRIPANHDVTLQWLKYFGLELEPFYPTDLAQVALLKGKRVEIPPDKPVDMSLVPLNLTEEERKVGLTKLDEYYYGETAKQIGSYIREDWPPEIARLGDIGIADYLKKRGASEDAIHYIVMGFQENAALDYIRDITNQNTFLSKIRGGNDRLPRAFAAKLSDVICYGCVVEHIDRGEKRVRIGYQRMGSLEQVEADAVVCTIPYSVLRRISVIPEWSPAKRNVIDKLYYGPVVRTTYQVHRRYWEDEGLNGFGRSDKNFEVWHPTFGKPGKRGLLQAYNYENYARELDRLPESERMERVISDMDEVLPGLRANLETVVVKSWVNDPWQRGAYTEYEPGQTKWYGDICKPEGRVWFAGEHASAWPGWMQGALTSGIKAAREINAVQG